MGRRPDGWALRAPRNAGGSYLVRFRLAGQRREISTGKSDQREAEEAAKLIYAQHVLGIDVRPVTTSSGGLGLPDLLGAWIEERESALDETTTATYELYARTYWIPYFKTLVRITTAEASRYTSWRLKSVQRRTVLKELSALRKFLRWAKVNGAISTLPDIESPDAGVVGRVVYDRRPSEIPIDVLDAVIAALPERTTKGNPVRAFFTVMRETGLRRSTLFGLVAPTDYRKGGSTLRIRRENDKARYGREVPLTPRARDALDSVTPASGPIFDEVDYRAVLKRAATDAGLAPEVAERISHHGFRHARITELTECSQDLNGIAFLAGHRRISTTDRYAHAHGRNAVALLALDASRRPTTAPSGGDSGGEPP